MHSARLSSSRNRRRRRSSTKDLDDDFQELSISSLSRPSTQDSKRSSYSRLSTDSGEGSLEDFGSRRNSSPLSWKEIGGRHHTAPIQKSYSPVNDEDPESRPNTVHVWDNCSPRCSLSRYAPLPAIGSQQQHLGLYTERPVPVRRQCFMGPLDINDSADVSDVNDNNYVFCEGTERTKNKPVFSLTLDSSDTDSDFEDESENIHQGDSDLDDACSKPKRPIIRSATFTIEKERPDIHGPFLAVAVRLPNGSRISRQFDCKETLHSVCEMALQNMSDNNSERWSLVTTDIPKRIFKDLTMSLKEAGIDDKTLLYMQSRSESDSE